MAEMEHFMVDRWKGALPVRRSDRLKGNLSTGSMAVNKADNAGRRAVAQDECEGNYWMAGDPRPAKPTDTWRRRVEVDGGRTAGMKSRPMRWADAADES